MIAPEERMGHDIARQFAHLPEQQAVAAIARHVETFWDPRMRDRLRALVASDADTLDPLLVAAARQVRDGATRKETDAQP